MKPAAGSNHHEVAGSNQYTIYLLKPEFPNFLTYVQT
jgi:hypothetical protein